MKQENSDNIDNDNLFFDNNNQNQNIINSNDNNNSTVTQIMSRAHKLKITQSSQN